MNSDVNDLDLGADAEPNDRRHRARTPPPDDDLAKAVDEREQLRDRLLRTTAEFDNFRKRVERDRREMADRAAESLLLDLLPVVDDLERALAVEATGEGAEAYRRGVELIHKQLTELLARRGVKVLDALGRRLRPAPAPGRRLRARRRASRRRSGRRAAHGLHCSTTGCCVRPW